MNKYIVFVNHGTEGWKILGEYMTLAEAVREATIRNYGSEFKVVKEVKWEPKEHEGN